MKIQFSGGDIRLEVIMVYNQVQYVLPLLKLPIMIVKQTCFL